MPQFILAQNTTQSSPAVANPAATIATAAVPDASEHLQHRLVARWNDLNAALYDKIFYYEAILVAVTLVLSFFVAGIMNRSVRRHLALHPPKFIDIEFLSKPMLMLGPSIAIFFLWIIRSIAIDSGLTGNFTAGITELAYAYWLAKCILLSIRSRAVAYTLSAAIAVNALLRATRVNRSMSAYLDSIGFQAGTVHITALHFVSGIIIFTFVFWAAGLLSRTFESYLRRSTSLTPNTRHLSVKIFKSCLYVAAFLTTLSAIGIDLTAFAIFSGAVGVGIGLGLQKLAANFVSGFTVLIERSIRIGDLIEVGGNTGWVRELNVRYMLLETSDGREVLIPNDELMSSRVTNWTLTTSEARIEIDVTVDFGSDPQKTRDLLLAAALQHPRCLKEPAPSCTLQEFMATGLRFTLSFWISDVTKGRNSARSDVMFKILENFQANGITLAK